MAKSKKITLKDLAVMTQQGFSKIRSELHSEITGLRTEMNERFDNLEHIAQGHTNRLDKAEDDIRIIQTKIAKR